MSIAMIGGGCGGPTTVPDVPQVDAQPDSRADSGADRVAIDMGALPDATDAPDVTIAPDVPPPMDVTVDAPDAPPFAPDARADVGPDLVLVDARDGGPVPMDAGADVRVDVAVTDVRADTRVDAPTACNSVINDATTIMSTNSTATPPSGSGGTIRPGHYHLTAWTFYSATPFPVQTVRYSADVTATSFQFVAEISGAMSRSNSTLTASGTDLTFTETCPNANVTISSYTATATTLTTISRLGTITVLQVFTLR